MTEIDFPNGKKYQFAYEPTPGAAGFVTGRIQQVTLPTGGTIAYQYKEPNGGINCADGTVLGLTRTINDGANSAAWDYSRVSSGLAGTTTVTAPMLPYDQARNQMVVTFDSKGHETSRKIYQGTASGNPLRTINTNWASNNTPATQFVILEDGSTQSEVETAYDSNGNLQSSVEHDWGQGAPGVPLRSTTLTYLPGATYAAANIINRVQDKLVKDGSGTIKFRTHIDYDQAGFVNNSCVTGAVQHDDSNYGCSYTTRGLPTAVTTYTDAATPSGAVAKNFSYDSLGNLVSAQLNCCQQKQWNFSSATQYAFPDSVVSGSSGGPQLTTNATYYLTTGQLKTSTDENGQVTTYSYADPGHLDRLTDVQRPDFAHSTTAYDDTLMVITTSSPVQGTNTVQSVTAFDGLGRPLTKKIEDSSNTVYSIVATQYDPLGRAYKSSNPYTVSPQFWTTNQFDALGRPSLTQLPDGAQGNSTYNLNSATVADPAGKQRRSFSDGLGRMIEVDEPGDTSVGAQAAGSITINDPLNSKPTIPSTSGSGSVTISGAEGTSVTCVRTSNGGLNCTTHWDTGNVSITVTIAGTAITKTSSFGQNTTAQTLANYFAGQFSQDANFKNVNVVANSSTSYTINLTASAVGSVTNYSYSAISGPKTDFTATTAGANFTGGTDGQVGATDSGTVTLTLGSFTTAPVCYGTACNSTAAQVATALAQALGGSGSPVHNVQVSGSTISMTANQVSAAWNVAVTATPHTNDPSDFPNGSFAGQGALSGGADQHPSDLAHPYITSYQYGVLDNLLQVTQGVQTRSYAYDGIGRLTDVTTPEAGHVQLGYNSFDLVTQRTDARGVVTSYSYDPLNRLKQIDYNIGSTGVPATPSVVYHYGSDPTQNNNGRVTLITDGLGSEAYTYDTLGRITQLQKVINGQTYAVGYAYNLAGEVTSMTYPSGTVVQQSFDAIGRLCEIAPQTTGCGTSSTPYAKTYSYNAAFQTTGFVYGNGVTAGLNFSADRLQLTNLSYSKGTQTLFGLNYFYKQDATNCSTGTTGNNGQIDCITDAVDSGRNATYTYDALGRLATAGTKGSATYPQWGLAFTVDRYGNLTGQTATAGSTPPNVPPVNSATNQISILPYDSNGNLLNDGNNALVYDAENRTVSSTKSGVTSTYSYDCKSLRAQKVAGGVTTVYIYSGGKVIAEYQNGALPSAPTRQYIYAGSSMLAKVEAGVTSYYHPDHLSNRITTDSNGSVTGQQGHFPFGQSWYDSNTTKLKFTTYEHDSESGNDYAMARYYASSLGRFTGPDPLAGSRGNPQTLNRYSYVANDPVNYADPSGRFLTALTLFLDRAGFPNAIQNMNEMWLMWGDFSYIEGSPSFAGGWLLVGPVGNGPSLRHRNLKFQALKALFNPDCAALFGGFGKALNALSGTTYYDYTSGMANPDPGFIPAATWTGITSGLNAGNAAETAFSKAGNQLLGDTFLASDFFSKAAPGFGTGDITGQMTIVMHELEHVALQSVSPPDNPSDANSADSTKINQKCKPKDIQTENGSTSGGLTGGTTP
jgi:RHS repeat-associated protein